TQHGLVWKPRAKAPAKPIPPGLPGYDELLKLDIRWTTLKAGDNREIARHWLELDPATLYRYTGRRTGLAPVEKWAQTEASLLRKAFERAGGDRKETLRLLDYDRAQYPRVLARIGELGLPAADP